MLVYGQGSCGIVMNCKTTENSRTCRIDSGWITVSGSAKVTNGTTPIFGQVTN